MLEISTRTYIDTRTGLTMFQMTMVNGGRSSSTSVDYKLLVNKQSAEEELCKMITYLCNMVYNLSESKE